MTFENKTVHLPSGDVSYAVGGDGPPVLYFHSAGGLRVTRGLELLAAGHPKPSRTPRSSATARCCTITTGPRCATIG